MRVEEELSTTSGRSTVISSVSIRAKASLVVASVVYKCCSESRGPDSTQKARDDWPEQETTSTVASERGCCAVIVLLGCRL